MPIDLGSEALSALLGAASGYALSYGAEKAKTFRGDRLLQKAWHFVTEPTVVVVPLVERTKIGASGGVGDLLAMSLLIRTAERQFRNKTQVEILRSKDASPIPSKGHIVVVGGGKHNSAFRVLVERLRVPLHFFDTSTESFAEIRNRERSVVYSPEYDQEGALVADTGIVVRARLIEGDGSVRWVVITAGSHTYGSEAAMTYLTSTNLLKEIASDLASNVEVVVRGNVVDHSVTQVKRISQVIRW